MNKPPSQVGRVSVRVLECAGDRDVVGVPPHRVEGRMNRVHPGVVGGHTVAIIKGWYGVLLQEKEQY